MEEQRSGSMMQKISAETKNKPHLSEFADKWGF